MGLTVDYNSGLSVSDVKCLHWRSLSFVDGCGKILDCVALHVGCQSGA